MSASDNLREMPIPIEPKIAATRWEQVFRESPEILEGAINKIPKDVVRRSNKRLGPFPLIDTRDYDILKMRDFIIAKDNILRTLNKKNIAPTTESIDQVIENSLGNADPFKSKLPKEFDKNVRIEGRNSILASNPPPEQRDINRRFKELVVPEGLTRQEYAKDLMQGPLTRNMPSSDHNFRILLDNILDINPKLSPSLPAPPRISIPTEGLSPKAKRNLLIGGGALAAGGGATGIALPIALANRDKTAETRLIKTALTRWEQVFRESPEILEDALRTLSKDRTLSAVDNHSTLDSMRVFIKAKDFVNAQVNKAVNTPGFIKKEWPEHYGRVTSHPEVWGIYNRKLLPQHFSHTQKDIFDSYQLLRETAEPGLLKRLIEAPVSPVRKPGELNPYSKLPGALSDFEERYLRDVMSEKAGIKPNLPPDIKPSSPSNLKRNLLIGGGALAAGGGATGIALPIALANRDKTAGMHLIKTALTRWQKELAKDTFKGTPLNIFEQDIAKRIASPSVNRPLEGNTLIRDFIRETPGGGTSPLRDLSQGSTGGALADLRAKLRSDVLPTPSVGEEVAAAACALPTKAAKSKLLRNLGIGAGVAALGTGGVAGYGAYSRAKNKRTAKVAAEELSQDDLDFLAQMEYSNPPSPKPSRFNSALSGALFGTGMGMIPVYAGAGSLRNIAVASGLGALMGGATGAILPNVNENVSVPEIVAHGTLPAIGSLGGGIGGAALGGKLFKGHMLGRLGGGLPGTILGGIGGSMLAKQLLSEKTATKIASELPSDMLQVLLNAARHFEQVKQAEMKEETTKSLHAPKYDRRMKFNTALDRSTHSTVKEETPAWLQEAAKKAFDTSSFDGSGVTGREGVITVEDELLRTPPLPTEDPPEYDVGNKPVMQKESAEELPLPEGEEGTSEKDMYSFTQRHPAMWPLLLGLGGAAIGAVPGVFGGGALAKHFANKAYAKKLTEAITHSGVTDNIFRTARKQGLDPDILKTLNQDASKAVADKLRLQSMPVDDAAARFRGRLRGGAVGGLTGGALGTIGGLAINRPQPWE